MTTTSEIILVTGGAGFIGSAFVLIACGQGRKVVNLDKLTYAGNPMNLVELTDNPNYIFEKGDIQDGELITALLEKYRPRAIVHFAAESHVDRSILGPRDFMDTNVMGTFTMLETARAYWNELGPDRDSFRFVHVSTDEVYGSLGMDDPAFQETTAYAPNSPYSASKAASDHLANAYFHTYGLPTMITNCSNNYGPRQFPEKLIPLIILNALEGKPLPVYGDGMNVRDWLYVDDHVDALLTVLDKGKPGETYNIGGLCEKANIEVVKTICAVMDKLRPDSPYAPHDNLIQYVKDRPGHDRRYAIDCSKIKSELGWSPAETFETGLVGTIDWYLDNSDWVESIRTGEYRTWLEKNYVER